MKYVPIQNETLTLGELWASTIVTDVASCNTMTQTGGGHKWLEMEVSIRHNTICYTVKWRQYENGRPVGEIQQRLYNSDRLDDAAHFYNSLSFPS